MCAYLHVQEVQVDDYLMDPHEVTNKELKTFVDKLLVELVELVELTGIEPVTS